jgi:hypothetical protein
MSDALKRAKARYYQKNRERILERAKNDLEYKESDRIKHYIKRHPLVAWLYERKDMVL